MKALELAQGYNVKYIVFSRRGLSIANENRKYDIVSVVFSSICGSEIINDHGDLYVFSCLNHFVCIGWN